METEQASLQLNYPQVTPLLQELNELQETAAADQQLPVTSFRQVKCSALKVTSLKFKPVLSATSPLLSKEGFALPRNTNHTPAPSPSSPAALHYQTRTTSSKRRLSALPTGFS